MPATTITSHFRDNHLTKAAGTYIYGLGKILAFTNIHPLESRVDDLLDLDNKKSSFPHYVPEKSLVDDLVGEPLFNIGMFTALALELSGMGYTAIMAYEGRWKEAALYPAAKVVTNGLAYLVERYMVKRYRKQEK